MSALRIGMSERKISIFRYLRIIVYVLAGSAAIWAFVIEPDRLITREYRLDLPGWPAKLSGLRIAAISDIHAGAPHITREKLDRIVAEVNATKPDLVLIAGDFIATGMIRWTKISPDEIARAIKGIHARFGTFAVLGNHDWWYDGADVRRSLEATGIRVLDDDVAVINVNGVAVSLMGIGDLWEGHPDLAGTLRKLPKDGITIALTHNPDIFTKVPSQITLTIAGHTHGGQVAIPLIGRPIVPSGYGQRYAIGHIVEQGRHLFVTPGIGTSILPVRFRVPPEISLLVID